MRKGLYRTYDLTSTERAYVDFGALQPKVFLRRTTYEVARYEPPFDQLPTQEEYEGRNH